jgi:deoxyhypusine synthase
MRHRVKRKSELALEPLTPLKLDTGETVDDLLTLLADTSFGARDIGQAWLLLKRILDDPECALVMTISGAMTIAKLSNTFGQLISRSIVKAVVTTGAVVTHSLVEEIGLHHYRLPKDLSDKELFRRKLNRIYDAIEAERSLEEVERLSVNAFGRMRQKPYGSFEIIRELSEELIGDSKSAGFLGSAVRNKVNVFVPALTDSELGLYLFRFNETHRNKVCYDPLADLKEFSAWLRSNKRIAFLTLGGGVPRNWAQQMLPFLRSDPRSHRSELPKVVGGVRICPDPVFLGHLSGSTYSEGISWGKFDSQTKKNLIEVHCDATIAFPFLAKAMLQYLDRD